MLLGHEMKLQSLEAAAKESLRKPLFFDPIAEGLYAEAIAPPKSSPRFDFVLHMDPPETTPSSHFVLLKDGTILHHNTQREFRSGNYGASKTLSDGTSLSRVSPEERANGQY